MYNRRKYGGAFRWVRNICFFNDTFFNYPKLNICNYSKKEIKSILKISTLFVVMLQSELDIS
jgi:hypothetical protein